MSQALRDEQRLARALDRIRFIEIQVYDKGPDSEGRLTCSAFALTSAGFDPREWCSQPDVEGMRRLLRARLRETIEDLLTHLEHHDPPGPPKEAR